MAGIGLDDLEVLTDEGSLNDFLEPIQSELARPKDDVEDMLDVIAREVNDDVFDSVGPSRRGSSEEKLNLDLDPISMEAISCSLQESMAKFDDFLERANASTSAFSEETEDKLTELKPIESSREKRGREIGLHLSALPLSSTGPGMSPRIRALSGEKLSSMPAMHHGYATTSSVTKGGTQGAGAVPQKNQAWDLPEPVLGEVTGNKMRRLLSDKSYFQSRPSESGPTEVSQNAAWGSRTKPAPSNTARTAMQRLLHGGSSFAVPQSTTQTTPTVAETQSSVWPETKPAFGGISLQEMHRLASTGASSQVASTSLQNIVQNSGAVQNSGMHAPASKPPAVASVSVQDMQRLAASGVSFSQAPQAGAAVQNIPQSGGMLPPNPAFASVSVQDMQRLATSGVPFSTQAQTTAPAPTQGAAHWSAPKPAFAAVSIQDMQRLASTGVSFPAQAATAATTSSGNVSQSAGQTQSTPWTSTQASPFASVSLQDMQRLASAGVSLPGQAQTRTAPATATSVPTPPWVAAPAPAFRAVTMDEMQRLANSRVVAPSQAACNAYSTGGQSVPQNMLTQAAPKPGFATVHVSLEDMQRLATTGVSMPNLAGHGVTAPSSSVPTQNAPWSSSNMSTRNAAPIPSVQPPMNVSTHSVSSQAAHPVKENVQTTQPASKPTFASVTIEDMQRLVDAYGSATAQPAPAPLKSSSDAGGASVAESKPASTTPVVVSLEEIQHLANGGSNGSVSQGHSSGSEGGTQNEMWQSAAVTREVDTARVNTSPPTAAVSSECKNEHVISTQSGIPPKKVSGGKMQRMLSEASYFQSQDGEKPKSSGAKNATWAMPDASKQPAGGTDSEGSERPTEGSSQQLASDPDEMLKKLKELMSRSASTQQALQEFDKARGLPRSHSQTMVNSSRSRKQIIENKIIAKWDGSPLISDDLELGKPKPRAPSNKKKASGVGSSTADHVVSTSIAPDR